MEKLTQEQVVLKKLKEQGYIDNFWAVHNYILRLGAVICELRKKGYVIKGEYDKFGTRGMDKNFYYTLENEPEK